MERWKGARFIGFHSSFPVEKDNRRTEILNEVLRQQPLDFDKMEFGRLSKGTRKASFSGEQLSEVLGELKRGEMDWLMLYPWRSDADWVKAQENQVSLVWNSSVIEPGPDSPVTKRFRSAGSVTVTYPLSWFEVETESSFQAKILKLLKRLAGEHNLLWAFIHEGFHPKRPASIGEDDVFQETREGFPLTSFDADLDSANIFFTEFVKGAFWVNLLNPFHVERLGGIQRIIEARPSPIVERMDNGGVLLQMGKSPLPKDYEKAALDYQRLRAFLKPILLETPEERLKFQMDLIGSWRPPGYDLNWKKISQKTPKR